MLSERHFVVFSYFIKYHLGKERKIVGILFVCSVSLSDKYKYKWHVVRVSCSRNRWKKKIPKLFYMLS